MLQHNFRLVPDPTLRSARVHAACERSPALPVRKPAKLVLEQVAHDIIGELVHRYRERWRQDAKTGRLDGKVRGAKPLQKANSWPAPIE